MTSVLSWLAIVLATITGIATLTTAHSARGRWWWGTALLLWAASMVLADPGLHQLLVAHSTAPSNLARLLSDCLAVAGASSVHVMLDHYQHPRHPSRRRLVGQAAVLLVVIAAMCTLLVSTTLPTTDEFTVGYAHPLTMQAYQALFTVVMAAAFARFGLLVRRAGRRALGAPLRLAVRLDLLSAGLGLTWVLCGSFTVAVTALDLAHKLAVHELTALLAALSLISIALGAAASLWAAKAARRWILLRVRRAVWRLTPLWQTLTDAAPQVRFPACTNDPVDQLYAIIIQIRDAQLALRHFAPAVVADYVAEQALARGLSKQTAACLSEAAEVAVAMDAARVGHKPESAQDTPALPVRTGSAERERGSVDLDAEARSLCALAGALNHPLVRNAREMARRSCDQVSEPLACLDPRACRGCKRTLDDVSRSLRPADPLT